MVGLVPRREVSLSKNYNVGDSVIASVIDTELEDGYSLLSLRKAAKDRGWDEVMAKLESGEIITVVPYDANRGGLLVEYEGIRGFLPVSQLSAEHYPRVGSSDKDEILQRLNSLVKKDIKARILDADRKANKLIFSEKEAVKEGLAERFQKLAIGDTVTGVVTGVVDFGVFVNVEGIEGLIHISEISWERVNNPSDYVKVGQTYRKLRLSQSTKKRLSLSMKQLTKDPWLDEVEQFKPGEKVEGTVTRITPFGAFVQLSPAVEALVHVSELGGDGTDPEKVFTLNERKEFTVLDIDKENRKISLSLGKSSKKK